MERVKPISNDPKLQAVLEKTKNYQMPPDEIEAQSPRPLKPQHYLLVAAWILVVGILALMAIT